MASHYFISIAMATYNGDRYLRAQLDSLLQQTRLPDELVITDDCSSDKTLEIINEFTKYAPFPVHFAINKSNLGFTGNFNEAISRTSGNLIFLCDQDDVWFPNKIEKIEQLVMENQNYLLFMNDAALTDSELNDTGLTKLGQIYSAGLDISTFVMGCCCAIKRELLDLSLPIPSNYQGHDNWLVGFADAIRGRYITREVLQYYRRYDGNTSQFIANTTTKISRLTVFRSKLISIFIDANSDPLVRHINQQRIFLDGLNRSIASNKNPYKEELQKYLKTQSQILELIKLRCEIRNLKFFRRICGALLLFTQRKYTTNRPLVSAIRDMIGI